MDINQTIQIYKGTFDEFMRHRNEIPAAAQVELKVWQTEPDLELEAIPTLNAGMLAVLLEIAKRQEGRRHTDGSQTERTLSEGRAGDMWGCDPK